jgi:Metallo-peptidase family M12/PKD domain
MFKNNIQYILVINLYILSLCDFFSTRLIQPKMKKLFFLSLFLIFQLTVFGGNLYNQISKKIYDNSIHYNLFKESNSKLPYLNEVVKTYAVFDLDTMILKNLIYNDAQQIKITIPLNNVNTTILLIKTPLFDDGINFKTQNIDKINNYNYTPGLYYQGIIENDPNSMVAISFFNNNIIGVLSNNKGNYNIGKFKNSLTKYVIYNDVDLKIANDFECSNIINDAQAIKQKVNNNNNPQSLSLTSNCFREYIECDYELYLSNDSSISNTFNYATGLYNIVATLFFNDSIKTKISEIKCWTSLDPYYATNTSDLLSNFSSGLGSGFNGDLAHLFSGIASDGGRAYLGTYCSFFVEYKAGVSMFGGASSFSQLPVYSWPVGVVSHEIGHNLGSQHTHDCVWNGNNTRIDNCGGHAGSVSGTCADISPDPPAGGTVMSYCHLVGVGINLALGFGPLPAQLIHDNINNATCLTSCLANSCKDIAIDSIKVSHQGNSVKLKWKVNGFSKIIEYTTNLNPFYTTYSIVPSNTDSLNMTFACNVTDLIIKISNSCNGSNGISYVFPLKYKFISSNLIPTDSVNVCSNLDSTIIKVDSNLIIGNYTFQWYRNNLPIINATNYKIKTSIVGYYYCKITDAYGCSNFTDSVKVTQNNNFLAAFSLVTFGTSVSFNANNIGNYNYTWNFGDGQTDSGINTFHNYASNGNYNICLTVSNNCYTDTQCTSVNIFQPGIPSLVSIDTGKAVFMYPNGVDPAKIDTNNLKIYSTGSGFKKGSYSVLGNLVSFYPIQGFRAGDLLNITSTGNISVLNGPNYQKMVFKRYVPISQQTVALFDTMNTGVIANFPDEAELTYADVDKNGFEDIIIMHKVQSGGSAIDVYKQISNGIFGTPTTYTSTFSISKDIETADLNQDGFPDLVYILDFPNTKIVFRLNNGAGIFGLPVIINNTFGCGGKKVVDLDADGLLDIVSYSNSSLTQSIIESNFNQGNLFFLGIQLIPEYNEILSMDLSDIDKDGDLDISYTTLGVLGQLSEMILYKNNAPFWPGWNSSFTTTNKYISFCEDLNNDGIQDYLLNNSNTTLEYYKGTATNVAPSNQSTVSPSSYHNVYGDINGDGSFDIIGLQKYANNMWQTDTAKRYLNNGLANFAQTNLNSCFNYNLFANRMVDIDNDGDLDFIYRNANNNICIAYNKNCFGNTSIFASKDSICQGGNTFLSVQNGNSFLWQPGSFTTNSIVVTPNVTTTYSVTITYNGGCTLQSTKTIIVNPLPTLTINTIPANATVCNGANITLTAIGANTYIWNPLITNGIAFNATNAITNYTVIGTNAYGCAATANKTIIVKPSPPLTVVVSPLSGIICIGDSVSLIATGANLYAWTGSVNNAIFFKPNSTQTYTVTATGANGCTITNTKTITVQPFPTLTITSNPSSGSVCLGESISLNATGADTISLSNNIINNTSFVPTIATTYTVTGTNAGGCSVTATKLISINTLPTITISSMPANATICNGQSIVLNATGGNSTIWSGGITNNVGFSPNVNSIFTVTVSNTFGCTSTSTKAIMVNATPSLTITSTPSNAKICLGQNVVLNATGATSINWSGGITNNVSFNPTVTNTYTVTASNSNNCSTTSTTTILVGTTSFSAINTSICQGQSYFGYTSSGIYKDTLVNALGCDSIRTINLTVNALPTISLLAIPANATVCQGTSMILTASGGVSYSWSNGITNNLPFTPSVNGTYTVTVTNSQGCTKSTATSITVFAAPTIVITPNNVSLCTGQSVSLSASGGITFNWSGGISNGVAFIPVTTGIYTVTVANALQCTKTATASVVVNNFPTISATVLPNDTICTGAKASINAIGASSFSISGGVQNGVLFTPTSNATYTITGTSSANCISTITKSIFLTPAITPTITINASPNPATFGSNITYQANLNINTPYNLSWYKNGIFQTNTFNQSFWFDIFNTNPTVVFAIISSKQQCLTNDSLKSNSVEIATIVDIDNNTPINFYIYPNPTDSKLFLFGVLESDQFEIYNSIGQLVLKNSILKNKSIIDAESYAKGIYSIRFIRGELTWVVKFIKK